MYNHVHMQNIKITDRMSKLKTQNTKNSVQFFFLLKAYMHYMRCVCKLDRMYSSQGHSELYKDRKYINHVNVWYHWDFILHKRHSSDFLINMIAFGAQRHPFHVKRVGVYFCNVTKDCFLFNLIVIILCSVHIKRYPPIATIAIGMEAAVVITSFHDLLQND